MSSPVPTAQGHKITFGAMLMTHSSTFFIENISKVIEDDDFVETISLYP